MECAAKLTTLQLAQHALTCAQHPGTSHKHRCCQVQRRCLARAGCLRTTTRHRWLMIACGDCSKLSTNISQTYLRFLQVSVTRLLASGCSPCSPRSLEKGHCRSSRGHFPSCERNYLKSGLGDCEINPGSGSRFLLLVFVLSIYRLIVMLLHP